MLFNSLEFVAFFAAVFIIHWALPHRLRWMALLAASYYFYMSWNAKYAALIFTATAVSYGCALWMEKTESRRGRKACLAVCLAVCLGILAVFKYFNFFSESAAAALTVFGLPAHAHTLKLLLPVGISFYTFQTLSYVIDVYRGKQKAERHFGIYALYVSYFPQLVAGPIERPQNLLPQLKAERSPDYGQATYGVKLMAMGYFKKLVVAAIAAAPADRVYSDVTGSPGFALPLATFFFAMQIYCDFSGYSDIARGASRMMGIDLMVNFKTPYFSCSFKEFWNRWHISLSTWFRDYVYIPLGGNRNGAWRRRRNVLATFLLSGLWHGANWTFVVWGGLHGLCLMFEDMLRGVTAKWALKRDGKQAAPARFCKTAAVFALTCVGWVFFRADTVSDAAYALTHMFDGISAPLEYLRAGFVNAEMERERLAFFLVPFALLFAIDAVSMRCDVIQAVSRRSLIPRHAIYVAFLLVIIIFSPKGMTGEFIYFQF